MAKIYFNTNTTENIIENAPDIEEPFTRGYLGMSGLAGACSRKLWYSFHFASKKIVSMRLKRIFERGDLEEARVIRDLKAHGMKVEKLVDGERQEMFGHVGEEQEEIIGFAGHAKGHPDGRVMGVIEAPKTEHLLEVKTMNNARWTTCKKQGVYISNPTYYGQAQRYMGGMNLTRTLFIATNKDNEKRLYERIYFDKDYYEELKQKEYEIIASDSPYGEKLSRANWMCKGCNHFSVCHDKEAPLKTCRSCEHVDLELGGKWVCSINNDRELSLDDQLNLTACKGRSYRRLF